MKRRERKRWRVVATRKDDVLVLRIAAAMREEGSGIENFRREILAKACAINGDWNTVRKLRATE